MVAGFLLSVALWLAVAGLVVWVLLGAWATALVMFAVGAVLVALVLDVEEEEE